MLACASGAVDPLGRSSIRCQSQSRLFLAHPAGPLALRPALPALPAVGLAPLLHSHSRKDSGRNRNNGLAIRSQNSGNVNVMAAAAYQMAGIAWSR